MAELKVTIEQFPLNALRFLKLQKEISKYTLVVPLRNGGAEWYHRYLDKMLPPHKVQELEIHSYDGNRQQKTLTVELPEQQHDVESILVESILLVDDIVDSGLTMKVAGTIMQHFYPDVPVTGLTWFRRYGANNLPPFKLVSLYTLYRMDKTWIVCPWEVE